MRWNTMGVAFSLLTVLGLVMASCAPAAGPASSPAATQPAAAAKAGAPAPSPKAGESPRYGGALTVSSVGDPPSLDTHQEPAQNTWMVVGPAYNLLVEYQPSQGKELFPGLAESWEMSKDGLTYAFAIRKGVKFHDGTPLTPQDAVFSLTRLWKPPQGIRTVHAGLMDAITSIEAMENQVKLTLTYPYSPMMAVISYSPSVIYPKKVVEAKGDMKTTVVGTGPFRFKSYTPGVGVELVKNPDYWVAGRPYLDRVLFLILKDNTTRMAALRTGRVKLTGRSFATLTPSERETIKKDNPRMVFFPSTGPPNPWFFMNLRGKPFNDKRVRKAVSLSIDRQAALKVISDGQGLLGRVFPLEGWGIPDDKRVDLPGYRQPKDADIAEAKRLMAEAGYPQGFKLTVLARTMSLSKEPAIFLTSQLARIGIDTKVEVLEDAVFWDRGRKAQHEAMVYTPSMTIPDVDTIGRFLAKGGALNFSGNENDQTLNELWGKQRRAIDEAQRKAIIEEIERYVLDEAQPVIPLLVPFTFLAHWPEVRNFAPGISEYGNNNLQEIWLAQ
ncbi:MAG: ABC transporter substrate-binding protein [Chloroflexi bacterium]|nr:ABC transporter substrate-binding protein [Chloroflexota bacterium]